VKKKFNFFRDAFPSQCNRTRFSSAACDPTFNDRLAGLAIQGFQRYLKNTLRISLIFFQNRGTPDRGAS
jgi:hypothetical protein